MTTENVWDVDIEAEASIAMMKKDDSVADKEYERSLKLTDSESVSDDKTFVIIDKERYGLFKPDNTKLYHVPKEAKHLYGCRNCEWRGTIECPFQFKGGKVIYKTGGQLSGNKHKKHEPVPLNIHQHGICDHRKWYLMTMGGTWEKRPTFSQWQNMFQKARGEIVSNKDYQRYLTLQRELDILEQELSDTGANGRLAMDRDELKDKREEMMLKRKEVYFARTAWVQLANMLGDRVEKQVDRETPRQVDMDIHTTKEVKVSDIHKVLADYKKSKAVDATYKEVQEDEKR